MFYERNFADTLLGVVHARYTSGQSSSSRAQPSEVALCQGDPFAMMAKLSSGGRALATCIVEDLKVRGEIYIVGIYV